MGMLLGGAEGDHHRLAPCLELRPDLGPGQLVQLERTDVPTLSPVGTRREGGEVPPVELVSHPGAPPASG